MWLHLLEKQSERLKPLVGVDQYNYFVKEKLTKRTVSITK